MYKYKNANFWQRFASDIINLVVVIGLTTGFHFLISAINQNSSFINSIALVEFLILVLILNYLILPIVTETGNIGMFILRLKFIESVPNCSFYKRNILVTFFWLFILIVSTIIMITLKSDIDNKIPIDKLPIIGRIFLYIITTFCSFWLIFNSVNYIVVLFRHKKMSLLDSFSGCRVVNIKQVFVKKNHLIRLIPIKVEHKEVIWGEING